MGEHITGHVVNTLLLSTVGTTFAPVLLFSKNKREELVVLSIVEERRWDIMTIFV